jgi:hypothetical protein
MKNNTLIAVGAVVAVVLAILYFRKPCGCWPGCRCCAAAVAAQRKEEGFLTPDETTGVIVAGIVGIILLFGGAIVYAMRGN